MFTSEWDTYSKKTYDANFGEIPFGDITKISENEIPDHDILLGGFPWQPFSIAGVSKKNDLGVTLKGRALRSNLLFVPHKRISTSIPNAKSHINEKLSANFKRRFYEILP